MIGTWKFCCISVWHFPSVLVFYQAFDGQAEFLHMLEEG